MEEMNGEKKKRVLFVALQLGPGGVVTYMMTMGKGLQKAGWEVAVVSRGKFGNHLHGPEWFEENGIRHFYVPFPLPYFNFNYFVNSFRAFIEFRNIVKEFHPDIIHVHWRSTSIFAKIIYLIYKIPFVSTLHHFPIPHSLKYRLFSFWGVFAIATSEQTFKGLRHGFKISESKIKFIRLGADGQYFRSPTETEKKEVRRRLGLRERARVVSFVGRFEKIKRHEILIKAIAFLKRKGFEVDVLLCGEGSRINNVIQVSKEYGVSDLVHIMKWYPDIREILWASDCFILPSLEEGFAQVIVEAMLCGVVPIRTPTGGAYDQIQDGINGFIIPFDDYETLAQKIKLLFENEVLREKMAESALATAREKFTAEKMVRDTIGVYEETIIGKR